MTTTDRYQHVASELTNISVLCTEYRNNQTANPAATTPDAAVIQTPTKIEITEKVDSLLGYMLDNFDEKTADDQAIADLFKDSANRTDDLTQLVEGAVTVAVLSQLLRTYRAPLDPSRMTHWTRFNDVYGERIEKKQ